jgi:MFS family permease
VTLSLRRNHDYALLWGGQTVSAIGSQVSGLVLPLLVLSLTGSAVQAGLVGAAEGVPYVVLGLAAGVFVDRWDRKLVMIVCDVARALNLMSIPLAAAVGHLSAAQLYVVALFEGTFFVFFNIAETASLPRVVPPEQLPSAVARQETTWGISALIGPALGGALYTAGTYTLPFIADAVSYVVSASSLFRIRVRFHAERPARREGLLSEMREALRWLWRRPLLRALAVVTAVGDLLFSGIGLIPIVIARQEMHAPAVQIGFIFTLAAVGAIAGSAIAARVQRRLSFSGTVIGTGWVLAGLFPLLAVAPTPLALGLVRTAMSGVVSVSNVARLSYPLARIPDALQGRVNGLTSLIAYGSLPIGQALTGLLLQTLGSRDTILLITACLVLLAAGTTASSAIRHAPDLAT